MLGGQVAIVTGAGRGLGAAAAALLASHGASIVVADLDGDAAASVAADIVKKGGAAVAVGGDLTAADVPQAIVQKAIDSFGRIDILVNNAGYTWDGVLHKMHLEQWQAMLDVHCTAPFRLVQAAAPHMRDAAKREGEAGGQPAPRCIIMISSTSGTHGNAGQANYATAKAGMVGLTKTLAKEWGRLNIRCNAIAFGAIDTRLTRGREGADQSILVGGKRAVSLGIPNADQYLAAVKNAVPLGRIGSVDDAAGAILLMASPYASYITGQVLEVNGGAYM